MVSARTVRGLFLAAFIGLTLGSVGCLKHSVAGDGKSKLKPRHAAESDTFEILEGDWMRQHERPYTPPAN